MVEKSSWRSLRDIAPLFNTWPRFWSARMTSFLLILVRCYLKTLKCAWELLFPVAFLPLFLSFFFYLSSEGLSDDNERTSTPLLFLFGSFWLVKSVRECLSAAARQDVVTSIWLMRSRRRLASHHRDL